MQRAKRKRHGLANWRLVRYADDFVVMVSGHRHHAEALREEVAAVLAPLGLRLAEEKTRVVHIDEGFDFLGFTIRRMRKRGTRSTTSTPCRPGRPSRPSRTRYRPRRTGQPGTWSPEALIQGINRALAGWANYFRHGVSKAVFSEIDAHAWGRIMRWLRHKYKQGRSGIGMPELRRRFCVPGTWRSQSTGSGSPAHPPCRSPATATAAATSRPRGHPSRSSTRLAQRARHVERPVR